MRYDIVTVAPCAVVDESHRIPLAKLCRACGVSVEMVVSLVEEGILEPEGRRRGRWHFSADSIRRVRVATRLQSDLDLNMAGIALAFDLISRVEELQKRLRHLEVRRCESATAPNET